MIAPDCIPTIDPSRDNLLLITDVVKQHTGKRGLNELRTVGLIDHDHKIGGYYRPDAPPKKSARDAY